MLHDTIAAVSTPYGKGGIAVIRISGDNTAAVLQGCFSTSGPNPVENPRRACLGTIMQNGETIDSGIAVYFAPGASFTGEALAEISCHGGTAVTAAVLEAVFRAGAEPAGPGEFTRRAFLNGKLSLTQAQAVGLLIDADTDSRRRLAAGALQGALREKTQGMRAKLTSLLASLYATIDYPEEDLAQQTTEELSAGFSAVTGELRALLATYRTGSAVADGVRTVICGAPNCGKSSLYNRILGQERAIVTDIAGTTRDILWDTADFGGITLRLADTAGLREKGEAVDLVEEIGVERSLKNMEEAELIFLVLDGSRPLQKQEEHWIRQISKRQDAVKVAVINKADLPMEPSLDVNALRDTMDDVVILSTKTGVGMEQLAAAVGTLYQTQDRSFAAPLIWDARHKATLEEAISLLEEAAAAMDAGEPADGVCTLAEEALANLSLLDGRGVSEEIVSEIFSRFCVGK
ncbi:MAG: tRNA uridine-5-carboxymethylaminomethyl(34) synthesis GTPase MnmE [Clostridiales bacterium]|jgi:tRNA modification GTPase|nr:tRNA uridine-5-carboxymethylaminomethyl(34) synthesis GTPase MnmE [Clostridiales bacterium]